MSGFRNLKSNDVELEHFSAASLIKLTVTHHEPETQGGELKESKEDVWFEYHQIKDLINLIDMIREDFE